MQAKKRVHLHDLAAHFEVSERTIFRDIAALSELGVPIITYRGEGYALLEGFFLPPLILTEGEASALLLGARMLANQADGQLVQSADDALAKLRAILPDKTLNKVEALSETIRFLMPEQKFNLDDAQLTQLREAILDKRVVRLTYHSYTRKETTQRDVEPHELVYSNGIWYMRGYCRLRQAVREFRLERIDAMQMLTEHFVPREVPAPARTYEIVQIRFPEASARWVREYQHYTFQNEISDGASIIMTYHPEGAHEMVPWILGWGAQAEVLAPASLRKRIREVAENLLNKLT